MPRLVVVLSGPVGSGKSTLANHLEREFGSLTFSTSDYLLSLKAESPRTSLQILGDELDRAGGRWVVDGLAKRLEDPAWGRDDAVVVVDSVRREIQVEHLRKAFGPGRVIHVHLLASSEPLATRYRRRGSRRPDETDFERARAHPTESRIDELAKVANIVIDTDRYDDQDISVIASHRLGFFARPGDRLVDVLVGGDYGSEGKGNIASYLAREYSLLVRVGGPNAGHKVLLESARGGHPSRMVSDSDEQTVYTHHHLPSGTRTSTARVLIGPGAVINLTDFLKEVADCALDATRLSIDPNVMLISPEVDRPAEGRASSSIGSTAQGVGAAAARRILDRGLPSVRLARDAPELKPYLRWAVDVLELEYRAGNLVMVEGTQGVGLSIWHGAYPWVTSRDTTAQGCCAEVGIPPARVRKVVMVARTYPIRVESPKGQSSGPMRWRPTATGDAIAQHSDGELTWQDVAKRSGLDASELEEKEKTSTTGRRRRVGEFDWVMLHRAAQLNRPTDVALTFADYLGKSNRRAVRFDQLTEETIRFIEQVEDVSQAPVTLISTRFSRHGIIDRRSW